MSQPENPAAFPAICLNDPGHPESRAGMTLRDWFAGQTLPTAWQQATVMGNIGVCREEQVPIVAAGLAYAAADAMLAARGGE